MLDPAAQETSRQYDSWLEKNKVHLTWAAREALLQHVDHLIDGHLLVTHAIFVHVQKSSNPRAVNLADKFVITGAEVFELAAIKAAYDEAGDSETYQGIMEWAPYNVTSLLGVAKAFICIDLNESQGILRVHLDPVTKKDTENMKRRRHNPEWMEMLRELTRLNGRTYISAGGHIVVRR